MSNLLISSKFSWLILFLCLIAAQCQATPQPTPPPTSPPPTPILIPPIQPGDGSDLMDRLLETGVIRVGIRVWPEAIFSPPAFRGFSNAETGGALNGFEVDLARLIAEGLGLELELVEAYPPVIATGDWRGQWDIAIASLVPFDQPQEASGRTLVFSRPYAYIPMGILSPTAANNIQALADLSGRRVGVLEHSAYQRLLTPGGSAMTIQQQPLLPQIPADVQPVGLSNLLKAIRQLSQPESESEFQLDAIFGPAPIFQEAVKSDLPVQWVKVGVQPLAIATVPQDNLKVDRLILEINKILERLQRQGTLAEIYLRWYGQDLSREDTLK